VWFAMVWPLIFVYLLYLVVQLPYRHARTMLRANALSNWRQVQMVLALLLFSWMAYAVCFERFVATNKSVSSGHARLIEATIIDSRFGLALLSPWLISFCLAIWATTLVVLLVHAASPFCTKQVNRDGRLK
jgi:ascorbate-specific PTS system EIIC-type component UlaA